MTGRSSQAAGGGATLPPDGQSVQRRIRNLYRDLGREHRRLRTLLARGLTVSEALPHVDTRHWVRRGKRRHCNK